MSVLIVPPIYSSIVVINLLIDSFIDYYKLSIEELKQHKNYDKIKDSLKNKLKYLDFCDLEYLTNLQEEQDNDDIDNKNQIKRCKDFRKMVYKDMINLLHDKKDIIINTHKNKVDLM